jgi:hypothetical protein
MRERIISHQNDYNSYPQNRGVWCQRTTPRISSPQHRYPVTTTTFNTLTLCMLGRRVLHLSVHGSAAVTQNKNTLVSFISAYMPLLLHEGKTRPTCCPDEKNWKRLQKFSLETSSKAATSYTKIKNYMETNRFWACELVSNGSELVPTTSICTAYAKPLRATY